jgi:tRNA(Ile)-lysidine synthase
MQILRPGVDVTFSVLERATNLIKQGGSSSRVDLKAGLRMFREENNAYIGTLDAEFPFDVWPQMPGKTALSVTPPGQVALAGGWKISCERWHLPALAREQAERNDDQFQVWLDASHLPDSLELRPRRPGDHFAPLGMDGHSQKISDFFVNEKIPLRARERWPLLCAGDEIVWVPGYRSAHSYRLTDTTRKIFYLSVSRPPEKTSE